MGSLELAPHLFYLHGCQPGRFPLAKLPQGDSGHGNTDSSSDFHLRPLMFLSPPLELFGVEYLTCCHSVAYIMCRVCYQGGYSLALNDCIEKVLEARKINGTIAALNTQFNDALITSCTVRCLPKKEIGNLKLAFLLSLRGQSLRTPVVAPPQFLASSLSSTRFR